MSKLYSVKEAAEALGVSVALIRKWVSQKRIDYMKMGALVKIKAEEIERLSNEGPRPKESAGDQNNED